MPTILILGDSISNGYTPYVERALAGRFEIIRRGERIETDTGPTWHDSHLFLQKQEGWLEDTPSVDMIHFNCGLHDLMRDRETGAAIVPLGRYGENLQRIVRRLQATDARLIWATTTPVLDERHQAKVEKYDRLESDVLAYNRESEAIMRAAGIEIDDLHEAICSGDIGSLVREDGVHMTEAGSERLGEQVVQVIRGFPTSG